MTTQNLPENLVIAMERSDRSNLIASNTCFLGLLRYARNDKNQNRRTAFAMTTCQQMAASS